MKQLYFTLPGAKMIIKNAKLLKRSEVREIKKLVESICKEYNIPNILSFIKIQKGITRYQGQFSFYIYINPNIILAYNVYDQFGFEYLKKVLRHEMAHYITWANEIYESDHGKYFKKINKSLGGINQGTIRVPK